ncbi:hypothetical protein DDIC_09650 [Desulfovibrio desulfuricans]|uniref:Uncharacterized protein n=1 Tax=Desulfovibrio desulfuricans TaxID=876 RepID=A0A4P7UMY7_DESDE|nr:hypothetical protein [Desulfovibrio desulfuricans]QCC86131.1 hypothetical protein DDIC_09650 [Desulfovibrio desulfuricans]
MQNSAAGRSLRGCCTPFSAGAPGSQDSGAFSFWRDSPDKWAKKCARRRFAFAATVFMNCQQHRMEEILGQGAAQFFTYFLHFIFINIVNLLKYQCKIIDFFSPPAARLFAAFRPLAASLPDCPAAASPYAHTPPALAPTGCAVASEVIEAS